MKNKDEYHIYQKVGKEWYRLIPEYHTLSDANAAMMEFALDDPKEYKIMRFRLENVAHIS